MAQPNTILSWNVLWKTFAIYLAQILWTPTECNQVLCQCWAYRGWHLCPALMWDPNFALTLAYQVLYALSWPSRPNSCVLVHLFVKRKGKQTNKQTTAAIYEYWHSLLMVRNTHICVKTYRSLTLYVPIGSQHLCPIVAACNSSCRIIQHPSLLRAPGLRYTYPHIDTCRDIIKNTKQIFKEIIHLQKSTHLDFSLVGAKIDRLSSFLGYTDHSRNPSTTLS